VGLVSRGDVIQAKLQALEGELRELWIMMDGYISTAPSGEQSIAFREDLEDRKDVGVDEAFFRLESIRL